MPQCQSSRSFCFAQQCTERLQSFTSETSCNYYNTSVSALIHLVTACHTVVTFFFIIAQLTPVFFCQYFLKVKTICLCFVGFEAVLKPHSRQPVKVSRSGLAGQVKGMPSTISACVPGLTSWMQFVFHKLAF